MMSSNGFQKAKVCHSNTTQHSKLHQDKAQFYIQRANFDLKNGQKICIIRIFITIITQEIENLIFGLQNQFRLCISVCLMRKFTNNTHRAIEFAQYDFLHFCETQLFLPVKGVFSKPSGNLIVAPNLFLLSQRLQILAILNFA